MLQTAVFAAMVLGDLGLLIGCVIHASQRRWRRALGFLIGVILVTLLLATALVIVGQVTRTNHTKMIVTQAPVEQQPEKGSQ